jgi:hypothetical protein
MTHLKTLQLKIALVFVMVLTLSFGSFAHASEVTGTLSSNGQSTPNTQPEEQPEPEISGSVVSPENNNTTGGGSHSNRTTTSESSTPNPQVLGASTYNSPGTTSSNVSSSSSSYETAESLPQANYLEDSDADFALVSPAAESGNSTTSSSPSSEAGDVGISAGSWFWIILLSLLLVGTALYFYLRPRDEYDSWQRI